jgi:hypothetical protein
MLSSSGYLKVNSSAIYDATNYFRAGVVYDYQAVTGGANI